MGGPFDSTPPLHFYPSLAGAPNFYSGGMPSHIWSQFRARYLRSAEAVCTHRSTQRHLIMRGFPLISIMDGILSPPKLKALSAALVLAGAVCGTSPSFAQTSPPVTGATASYDIALEAGPNLVALPVVPSANAVTDIVSGVLPQLTLVQSNAGRYFIPAQGIDDLGSWNWAEAYKVELVSPATLTVEGPEILPQFSPLLLESQVGNWVPYFRREPMAVAEAFAPIAASLTRVEATDGRFYQPGDETSTLDSLRTGRGYTIWVTQATALTYPANPAQQADGSAVNTLGEALALTGLTPGQVIEILGYDAPGDGGGGTFLVTDGGETPDGGLVFVPYEAQAGPITETRIGNASHALSNLPAGQDVVFGSVSVDLLDPNTEELLLTIDGKHLHGHIGWQSNDQQPMFDYETGHLHDYAYRIYAYYHDLYGTPVTTHLRTTYRATTSDLRLVRQGVGDTLNVRWFGARTYAEDPAFDNQPVLAHVMNVANARNVASPGSATTLYLPNVNGQSTVYEYWGSIEMGDGMTLAGEAGAEVVEATTTLTSPGLALEEGTYTVNDSLSYVVSGDVVTYTYYPTRRRSDATILRVKAGEGVKHIRRHRDPGDAGYLPPDAKHVLDTGATLITSANDILHMGLENIVLDGNWEAQITEYNLLIQLERETWFRNSPGWSGFVVSNTNGKTINADMTVRVRNVEVSGYGASSFLGNVNAEWDAENVRTGNAVYNHAFYGPQGRWANLTVEGFAWSHVVSEGGRYYNFVYEDGADSPTARSRPEIINYRYDRGRPFLMDGFFFDFRGTSQYSEIVNGNGYPMGQSDGVVITSPNKAFAGLYKLNGTSLGVVHNNDFKNIDVFVTGGAGSVLGYLNAEESIVDDVQFVSARADGDDAQLGWFGGFRPVNGEAGNQFVMRDVDLSRGVSNYVLAFSVDESLTTPREHFILNSKINNRTNALFAVGGAGLGILAELGDPDNENAFVLFQDSELRLPQDDHLWNLQAFLTFSYHNGTVDTASGRTSESSGTVSFTASGGETYVDVDPELWWVPMKEEYVTYSGADAGLIASVLPECPNTHADVQDAFGMPTAQRDDRRDCDLRFTLTRALTAGEQVTFDWTAAVQPWPDGVTVPAYAE